MRRVERAEEGSRSVLSSIRELPANSERDEGSRPCPPLVRTDEVDNLVE
jgi:hypothetical protein